jgi:hypothetical protein
MATLDENSSLLSSEAFDVLDCFVAGLDDVVYKIAERVARKRSGAGDDEPVTIVVDDIREAAKRLFVALRSQPDFPNDLVDRMERLFIEKCEGR